MTPDTISKVSQYKFNTKELSVTPKHVKLMKNEEDCNGISCLETISNPVKIVNNTEETTTRDIGSIASR